mmetsp:Transcript_20622/g.43018  ORF Transcript_20622/g.43018 Transcript_20622/m.43018 type:complete len:211 (+) Transcript_20622:241-873(+)
MTGKGNTKKSKPKNPSGPIFCVKAILSRKAQTPPWLLQLLLPPQFYPRDKAGSHSEGNDFPPMPLRPNKYHLRDTATLHWLHHLGDESNPHMANQRSILLANHHSSSLVARNRSLPAFDYEPNKPRLPYRHVLTNPHLASLNKSDTNKPAKYSKRCKIGDSNGKSRKNAGRIFWILRDTNDGSDGMRRESMRNKCVVRCVLLRRKPSRWH